MKMTYEEWKRKVDDHIYSICGLSSDDLGDWAYADAYARNMRPELAGRKAMLASGFGMFKGGSGNVSRKQR